MTCPSERLLIASALGELSPNDAVAIGEHLKTCERCAASTREHAELAVLLRAGGLAAPLTPVGTTPAAKPKVKPVAKTTASK